MIILSAYAIIWSMCAEQDALSRVYRDEFILAEQIEQEYNIGDKTDNKYYVSCYVDGNETEKVRALRVPMNVRLGKK